MVKIIEGIPYGHWETGTEGVHWCIQANWDSDSWSYEDMHVLENGDKLTIWNARKQVVFDGVVNLRRDLCLYSFPNPYWEKRHEPGYEKSTQFIEEQVLEGMYVHGVQEGVSPPQWFKWFMDPNHGAYTARLEKSK